MSFAREADVACPRIFKRLRVMKPSPLGENKFGDGDSCGMHGLRFSAPTDGDGHLPNGHPGAPVRHTAALLAGRLAPLPDLATMQPPCHELDSSSMICWLAYNTCVCVDRRCRFCPHNHRRQLRVPPSSVLFTVHCGHLPLAMAAHSSHPLGSGNTDRANSASGQASKGPPACKHQMDPSF